jgi:hypothetical protein
LKPKTKCVRIYQKLIFKFFRILIFIETSLIFNLGNGSTKSNFFLLLHTKALFTLAKYFQKCATTLHYDIQHNNTQHNDTLHIDTQHNNKQNVTFSMRTLSIMLSIVKLQCPVMLSVMLSVVIVSAVVPPKCMLKYMQ